MNVPICAFAASREALTLESCAERWWPMAVSVYRTLVPTILREQQRLTALEERWDMRSIDRASTVSSIAARVAPQATFQMRAATCRHSPRSSLRPQSRLRHSWPRPHSPCTSWRPAGRPQGQVLVSTLNNPQQSFHGEEVDRLWASSIGQARYAMLASSFVVQRPCTGVQVRSSGRSSRMCLVSIELR